MQRRGKRSVPCHGGVGGLGGVGGAGGAGGVAETEVAHLGGYSVLEVIGNISRFFQAIIKTPY